jgi:hypothetical protein
MRGINPACAVALAMTVAASAQDSTAKSKTTVKADDARTVVMTGCLAESGGAFMLADAKTTSGEDLTIKSQVKTDVDKDDTTVKTKTRAELEHDGHDAVGTSGSTMMYELAPRSGVELAAHVGHRVEIAGVMLDPAKGDDDAEITIKEETKVKADDAPDSKVKSKTKAELPRGAHARLAVVSVTPTSGNCTAN